MRAPQGDLYQARRGVVAATVHDRRDGLKRDGAGRPGASLRLGITRGQDQQSHQCGGEGDRQTVKGGGNGINLNDDFGLCGNSADYFDLTH